MSSLAQLFQVQDPQLVDYLDFLTSCDLDSLLQQPKLLDQEAKQILQEREDLVCKHYRAFLGAHQHTKEMHSHLKTFSNYTAPIETKLPDVQDKMQGLEQVYQDYIERIKVYPFDSETLYSL